MPRVNTLHTMSRDWISTFKILPTLSCCIKLEKIKKVIIVPSLSDTRRLVPLTLMLGFTKGRKMAD